MSAPPTFANDRDRVVYLLAEFKVPLTVMLLAAGVWAVWASPQLPTVPQPVLDFALAAFLLALPLYAIFLRIMASLHHEPRIWVGIADPGTNVVYDGRSVDPAAWENRTTTGAPALEPDEGCFDVVVTRFNYYEEIDEIEVRGCEEQMDPATLWENRERVDELYEHHHSVRRAYSRLKATVGRYATELHDAVLMKEMAENEKAQTSPDVSVTSIIEEMEDEVDGMPDTPDSSSRPQHVRVAERDLGQLDERDVAALDDRDGDGPSDEGRAATGAGGQQPAAADGGTRG